MSDYWMPPWCPGCGAILDSEGRHWASGATDCATHEHAAEMDMDRLDREMALGRWESEERSV